MKRLFITFIGNTFITQAILLITPAFPTNLNANAATVFTDVSYATHSTSLTKNPTIKDAETTPVDYLISEKPKNLEIKYFILAMNFLLGGSQIIWAAYNSYDFSPQYILAGLATMLVGIEMGDMLSGINHAILDNINTKNRHLPRVIRNWAHTFQRHHTDVELVTKRPYITLISPISALIFPFLVTTAFISHTLHPEYTTIANIALLCFAQDQFIHACAHGKKCSNALLQNGMEFLRKQHILLNWSHHSHHHKSQGKFGYCGITGHMDIILDPTIHALRSCYPSLFNPN